MDNIERIKPNVVKAVNEMLINEKPETINKAVNWVMDNIEITVI